MSDNQRASWQRYKGVSQEAARAEFVRLGCRILGLDPATVSSFHSPKDEPLTGLL